MNGTDNPLIKPWHPMSNSIDVKHLGKLAEELGECSSAVARCLIQGVDECEPTTGKPNITWLEDEIADVLANIELVSCRFKLDMQRIRERADRKKVGLQKWHYGA